MPSSHLVAVFEPTTLRRIAAMTEIKRRTLGADIVVVRGLSGILVASAMSTMFNTPFAVVRKDAEMNHGRRVEIVEEKEDNGDYRAIEYKSWVIIDDLICSGRTVNTILSTIYNRRCTILGSCVGIILYYRGIPATSTYRYRPERGDEQVIPVYELGDLSDDALFR